jgi:hypothetical protein
VHGLPWPLQERGPLEELPLFLVDSPLHALEDSTEPDVRSSLESLPELMHMIRYQRLVLPRKTRRDTLAEILYCRQDFRMVHLPDSLFWLYAPLRPVLFVLRKLPISFFNNRDSQPET